MTKPERQTKPFYNADMVAALNQCIDPEQQGGAYKAQFMPGIIDERMNTSDYTAPIWSDWHTSLSLRATGKSKQGNAVVVYAHVPHELSTPEGMQAARKAGLVNGAGKLSKNEFYRLLDLEDKENVFVVDYNALKNSESDVIPVSKALAHPQTIPFLGGSERAEAYLEKHKEAFGKNIGIWHSDDLGNEPVGRVLFVGGHNDDGNLNCGNSLNYDARFVGVREVLSAEGGEKKHEVPQEIMKSPSLEQVISLARGKFIAEAAMPGFEAELKKLYK